MSSQISQIHMRKPLREPRSTAGTIATAVAGVLAIGTAAAWWRSSTRERALTQRTRARLAARPVPVAAPVAQSIAVPNASDIHVG